MIIILPPSFWGAWWSFVKSDTIFKLMSCIRLSLVEKYIDCGQFHVVSYTSWTDGMIDLVLALMGFNHR